MAALPNWGSTCYFWRKWLLKKYAGAKHIDPKSAYLILFLIPNSHDHQRPPPPLLCVSFSSLFLQRSANCDLLLATCLASRKHFCSLRLFCRAARAASIRLNAEANLQFFRRPEPNARTLRIRLITLCTARRRMSWRRSSPSPPGPRSFSTAPEENAGISIRKGCQMYKN